MTEQIFSGVYNKDVFVYGCVSQAKYNSRLLSYALFKKLFLDFLFYVYGYFCLHVCLCLAGAQKGQRIY